MEQERWLSLKHEGWKIIAGTGLETWWYLIPTSASKPRRELRKGVDYFTSLSDILSLASPPARRVTRSIKARSPLICSYTTQPTFALFAFNCTSGSDAVRMDMLKELYPSIRITSASEQEPPQSQTLSTNPFHYSCDFKKTLLQGMDENTIVLMLDYFWLQSDWWTERYGKNWICPQTNCKLLQAFVSCPRLNICIIPLDSSQQFMKTCVMNSRDFLADQGLKMECINWETAQTYHPLCLATARVCEQMCSKRELKGLEGQSRYVDEDNSFVVVHRESINWRHFLSRLRITSGKKLRRS